VSLFDFDILEVFLGFSAEFGTSSMSELSDDSKPSLIS
jgi:hypothetical protein